MLLVATPQRAFFTPCRHAVDDFRHMMLRLRYFFVAYAMLITYNMLLPLFVMPLSAAPYAGRGRGVVC